MEIRHTIEILTKDIQDIEKLVGSLQNSPGSSALELDLALTKLRNVYEILTMIRADMYQSRAGTSLRETGSGQMREGGTGSQPGESLGQAEEESSGQAIGGEGMKEAGAGPGSGRQTTASGPEETDPEDTDPDDTDLGAEGQDRERDRDQGKAGSGKSEQEKISSTPKKEAEILAEKFTAGSRINENIAEKSGRDKESKVIGKPIDTISRNIGINDRFLIIRELFNGDAEKFRNFLENLDRAGSFTNAEELLRSEFSDQIDHEGVGILATLVKRRYP